MYRHKVVTNSGETFEFTERNIFDFGRVINPDYTIAEGVKGGLIHRDDAGDLWWQDFKKNKGWFSVRKLSEGEVVAYNAVNVLGGFAHSGIRM